MCHDLLMTDENELDEEEVAKLGYPAGGQTPELSREPDVVNPVPIEGGPEEEEVVEE